MSRTDFSREDLVLTEQEKANIRSAHSQVDFNTQGTYMFQLTEEQADVIEAMRAQPAFSESEPGEHANQPYVSSLIPNVRIVQLNPTNPHIFVDLPIDPSPEHYIQYLFVENMRGDILHYQRYWPSFTDPPKLACEGSALTTSVTVYIQSSKYGIWRKTVEVPPMSTPTDKTILEAGGALWWLTEECRGPANAFQKHKAGIPPVSDGSPFEPENSGFI